MRTDYEIAGRLADKAAKRGPNTPELIEYTDRLWEYAAARREGKRVSTPWQDRYLEHRIS